MVDVGAGNIGEAYHLGAINEPVHLALHGALGCAAGAAISGNCGTGAAGQVAGELAGELYKNSGGTDLQTGLGIAQISGGVAAVLAGGDEKDVYAGANIGQAAAENNSFAVAGPATPELIAACVAMPVACATLGAAAVLAIYVAQKRTNAEGFDIAGAVEQLPGYEASSDEGFVDQGVDVATNTPATEGFDAYEPSVGNNDEGFSILPDWLTNGWNVLFSENAKFSDQGKLDDHFDRHGQDFNASTATEYEKQASDFLTSQSSSDILEKIRSNGDLIRFNPKTDEFGVISSNGTIRTYFSMLSV
ncbi:MAG: hypothetical protein K0R98_1839 [Rickettsiaceae bacterium]|nr:hypothetical protein [Rickettsiaceae bacterium]